MVVEKMRTAATFAGGLIAGVVIAGALFVGERPGGASNAAQAPVRATYADASGQSWKLTAQSAVSDLRAKGIIVTPSLASYNGNAYVTRFEAAVLIDRFVHYVEAGRKPLHPTTLDQSQMPKIPTGPSHAQMVDLVENRYIVTNSPLIQAPLTSPVTARELSDAMTTAVTRVIDRSLKPVGQGEVED